jgi:transposase
MEIYEACEAGEIGLNAAAPAEVILRQKRYPEQGFRCCRGIVKLVGRFPRERVEAARERALAVGARSFTSVSEEVPSTATNSSAVRPGCRRRRGGSL